MEIEQTSSRKFVLRCMAILAVNLSSAAILFAAFYVYLIVGETILALLLLSLALPFILLQPWGAVVWVLPLFTLSPRNQFCVWLVVTSIISTAIYVAVMRRGRPALILRLLKLIESRTIRIVYCGAIILTLLFGVSRYFDFPSLHRGVPSVLSSWGIDDGLQNRFAEPRYIVLRKFINSEILFQALLSEKDFELLMHQLQIIPIPVEMIPSYFWSRSLHLSRSPYWWQPLRSSKVRSFASADFVSGSWRDGTHFIAVWNPTDQMLHLWVLDNF